MQSYEVVIDRDPDHRTDQDPLEPRNSSERVEDTTMTNLIRKAFRQKDLSKAVVYSMVYGQILEEREYERFKA